MFSCCILSKNLKFEESGIKGYHEFTFKAEQHMIATLLYGSPVNHNINLVKKKCTSVKPLKVLEEILKSPRKNKAASFDVSLSLFCFLGS